MTTTIRPASADDRDALVAWAGAMALETDSKRLDPATVAHLRQAICATSSDHAPQPSFCS